jgi:hypothetical protein
MKIENGKGLTNIIPINSGNIAALTVKDKEAIAEWLKTHKIKILPEAPRRDKKFTR